QQQSGCAMPLPRAPLPVLLRPTRIRLGRTGVRDSAELSRKRRRSCRKFPGPGCLSPLPRSRLHPYAMQRVPAELSIRAESHGKQLRKIGRPVQADFLATNTGDRKSTRLNSSHRTISYAVFCLKKKKKKNK